MNPTTRIALLAFFCGGLFFWLGAKLAAPLLAPAPSPNEKPLAWQRRVSQFKTLKRPQKLVFLGDSRVEDGLWGEWLGREAVSNRGINGDKTIWMLERLPDSVPGAADAVVLQLGVNDLMRGDAPKQIMARMSEILDLLRRKSRKVVVTSVIFVAPSQIETNRKIADFNRDLRRLTTQKKLVWVDLNAALAPQGFLDARYSNDGLHLNGRGYELFVARLRPVL